MTDVVIHVDTENAGLSGKYLRREFRNLQYPPDRHHLYRLDAGRDVWGKVLNVERQGQQRHVYVRVNLLDFAQLYYAREWNRTWS
jgi:hypothetical protein